MDKYKSGEKFLLSNWKLEVELSMGNARYLTFSTLKNDLQIVFLMWTAFSDEELLNLPHFRNSKCVPVQIYALKA